MSDNTPEITVGTVIRYRWNHPWNSWMDRWGTGVVTRIVPEGEPMAGHLQADFGWEGMVSANPYWMFPKPEDVYPDQHDIVEGEVFGIPACTTCGVSLAGHHYPRRQHRQKGA